MKSKYISKQLLTVNGAANIKKVSRQAVYDAIKSGKLRCEYMLDRPVIHRKDLDQWEVVGRRGKGPLSPEHKAKISEGLKRHWKTRK